jgi:hypothetical protein
MDVPDARRNVLAAPTLCLKELTGFIEDMADGVPSYATAATTGPIC